MAPKGSPERGLIRGDDSLILIIDMQERLLPVISGRERIIENAIKLIRFSKIMSLPVIVTEQENLGATVPEIAAQLDPFEPVRKVAFNGFGSYEFRKRLELLEPSCLIIAGVEAHICVAQTALHAAQAYTVHVVDDAVSSRAPSNVEVARNRLLQCGVAVTSTEMLIYEILERADTPHFREVLQLVK